MIVAVIGSRISDRNAVVNELWNGVQYFTHNSATTRGWRSTDTDLTPVSKIYIAERVKQSMHADLIIDTDQVPNFNVCKVFGSGIPSVSGRFVTWTRDTEFREAMIRQISKYADGINAESAKAIVKTTPEDPADVPVVVPVVVPAVIPVEVPVEVPAEDPVNDRYEKGIALIESFDAVGFETSTDITPKSIRIQVRCDCPIAQFFEIMRPGDLPMNAVKTIGGKVKSFRVQI